MLFPLPKGISYKRRRGSVPLGSLLGLVPKFILYLIRGLFLRQVTASTLSSGHLDLESRLTGLLCESPNWNRRIHIWYMALRCMQLSLLQRHEIGGATREELRLNELTVSNGKPKLQQDLNQQMFRYVSIKKIRLCSIWVSLLLKAWNVGGSTGNAPKMPVHRHVANEVQGGFPSLLNFISSTASTLAIQRCHDVTKQSVVLWFSKFSTLGANLDQHFQAVFCLAGKNGSGI